MLHAYDGPTFIVLEPDGDMPPGRECGLYHEDTRFLSRHALRLGGARPLLLSARIVEAHLAVAFLTNPALPGLPRGSLMIRRSFAVGGGLHADLDVTNHAPHPVQLVVELDYDADFADVFEVKQLIEMPTGLREGVSAYRAFGRAVLGLAPSVAEGWARRTEIRFSRRPVLEGRTARFELSLAPGERFAVCQDVLTIAGGDFSLPTRRCISLLPWESGSAWEPSPREPTPAHPHLVSDDPRLTEAFEQAIRDLFALRIRSPDIGADEFRLAAGVPWYMALFGRDSLVAALQALACLPDLAPGVLRSLARRQGTRDDPVTEEQPGKILHEDRPPGLVGARRFVPRFPYYGSVDATPLFVVLASEYFRRTGDLGLVRSLESSLEAAVAWVLRASDARPDGFLEYARRTEFGLWNQGWKDSDDSVRFHDGHQAEPPIALVEVQGYAVRALSGAASLWRALGRAGAEALEARAQALQRNIDRAFWDESRGFWAMALDGKLARVDALTTNPGHLLWSGAASPDRIAQAAKTLVGPGLFSGFGLRTMACDELAYSPISYHNGSVWPHDTALVAAGLARYGRREEAAKLCEALLDAAEFYPGRRLPELFAGLERTGTPFPVEYPTSNSPQAWAAGAMLLVATTILGLDIDVPARRITVDPALPDCVDRVTVTGIPVAGAQVDVHVRRRGGRVTAEVCGAPGGFELRSESRALT